MAAHARLSPSASARWMACPASVTAEERWGIGDDSNVYSREGTFAHDVAERCLREERQPRDYLHARSDGGEFTVTEEWIAPLSTYVMHCRGLVLADGVSPLIEQRVDYSEDIWGTADFLGLSSDGKRLHVADLKWGQGVVVSAERNAQMLTYAAAAIADLLSQRQFEQLEEVHLHVVQPRAGNGQPSTWICSRDEVVAHARLLDEATRAALGDNPPYVPGTHCRFCKAASNCEALRANALQHAQESFVPQASGAEVASMLAELPQIEAFCKAVRQRAHELAEQGMQIPGYKLVQSIGNRKWIDPVEASTKLAEAGIDPWAPAELLSPAQAKKKLGKSGDRVVEPLVHRPTTGTKLVPESAKGEAIAPPVSGFLPSTE